MGKVRSLGKPSRVGVFVYSPIYAARRDVTCEPVRTYAVNPPAGDYFEKIIMFILRKILDWA